MALPALTAGLAGCMSCEEGDAGCVTYRGPRATAPLAGPWDAQLFLAEMGERYDEARIEGSGGYLHEDGLLAHVSMTKQTPADDSPWLGELTLDLYTSRGRQTTLDDGRERALEEWPGERDRYDRLVADLARINITATGEPVISCSCWFE